MVRASHACCILNSIIFSDNFFLKSCVLIIHALQADRSLGAVLVTGRVNVTPPSNPDSLYIL